MDRLDRSAAAVLVIDVQNDFCAPDGYQSRLGRDVARTHLAVAAAVGFTIEARRLGVPVVYVQNLHEPASETPQWQARHVPPRASSSCTPGSWGAEFFQVRPEEDDRIVTKSRYNAFTNSSLAQTLDELGRRSLFFCGVATSICVETSLRDAACRDFIATLVDDCCADYTPEAHDGAVRAISRGFGAVMDSEAVLGGWR